jgi:hypothetical protein
MFTILDPDTRDFANEREKFRIQKRMNGMEVSKIERLDLIFKGGNLYSRVRNEKMKIRKNLKQ